MAEPVVASSASSCFCGSRSRSRVPPPPHSRSLTLRITPTFSSPIHHRPHKAPSLFPRNPPLFLLFQSPATPTAASALDSDVPRPQGSSPSAERSPLFRQWDSLTAQFSASSNIPFLLLQLPQIILNARNLLSGNRSALLAVPWLGMLTGLLGNLSLLSYFIKKREKEAVVVQTLGVVSIYVVVSQLAIGRAMPLPIFLVTSLVVATGLLLNFSNYFHVLPPSLWSFWEDFITIGGLSALPQVMWSTFVPYIPHSILPGSIACFIAFVAVLMARTGKLSEKGVRFVGAISGWTATLLFMWMPVSQMWTNFLNPDNIKGLSASSMLLAMIGNGLMIPRALFIRDFMWFTGSAWAALFYGYGNIACLYSFNCISREFFLGATAGLVSWIGIALWRDMVAYGYNTPSRSIKELVFGP
ncbi:maltose excess protein 1-like, chloroplastic [Rhodamnia argentea]|uniref:Maltose excess protein 1-like, chloroplastic n=1 Tax=Rhodamnia argentea TaxID=178133 RepID=A0A8B8PEE9_9MYRT|nr:maltose excess protein 1-like, chloroplastic [Rhodamnia argentea]